MTDEGKEKAGLGGRKEGEKGGRGRGKKREWLTGGAWSTGHCQPGPGTHCQIYSLSIDSTCIEPTHVPDTVRDTAVSKPGFLSP